MRRTRRTKHAWAVPWLATLVALLLAVAGPPTAAWAEGGERTALEALEERVPAEVLGVPVETWTADAAWLFEGSESLPGAGAAATVLDAALAAAGRTRDDLLIVNGAWASDVDSGLVSLHEVPGMDGEALLAALQPAFLMWYDDPHAREAELHGHPVTLLSSGPLDPSTDDLDAVSWLAAWVDDDVVWTASTNAAIVDAAFDVLTGSVAGEATGSAADLILADVEAGRIDGSTGLLYRVLAIHGDPDLPERYAAGPAGEDATALADVLLAWPTLPPEITDALTPYLVRPSDPRSVFHEPGSGAALASVGVSDVAQSQACGPDGWSRLASDAVPLVVWAPCAGGSGTDGLATTLGMLEELYPPMVALMGDPIPDSGGSDGGGDLRIDIYLVERNRRQSQAQGGREVTFAPRPGSVGETLAMAGPTSPLVGRAPYRSSGFILVRRDLVGPSPAFRSALAHELFHVLQFAHNLTGVRDGSQDHWFTEASAVWAEHYFVPEARPATVYPWLDHFQARAPSGLTDRIGGSPYSAYMWPLFMEQEQGAEAIAAAWRAIEGTSGRQAVNAAIGSVVPFDARFGEFAARAWNGPLPARGGGDAVSPRFQALDPRMPEIEPGRVKREPVEVNAMPAGEPSMEVTARVAPLGVRYYDHTIAENIQKLVFDVSPLQPAADRTVEAIIHLQAGWVRQPISGDRLELCPSSPATRFDRLILVVADHDPETAIGDAYRIQAVTEPCELGSYSITLEGFFKDGTPKRANGTWTGKAVIECYRLAGGGWQISLDALDDPRNGVATAFFVSDGREARMDVLHDLDLDLDHWWLDQKEGAEVQVRVTEVPTATTVTVRAQGTYGLETLRIEGTLTCSSVFYLDE